MATHADFTVHQPVRHVRHLFQIRGKTIEAPDGLLIPLRTDGHPMFAAANVDAGCIGDAPPPTLSNLLRLVRQGRFPLV
jgi:hypothetical protein